MGPGDVCRVPLVALRHGRARQTSETGPCGDCRRVLWVPGARCQYFVLWRNMGYKTRVVAMLLNIVLNPREAYPEVKLHGRDIVRVVGIVDPFATIKGRYPEIIRFIEPQGGNGPS